MNLYKKYKYLQITTFLNLIVLLIILFAILGSFFFYYMNSPDDSPIKEKLKIGKYISLFELDSLFYNYRSLNLPTYELNISQNNLQKLYNNLPPRDSIMTDKYKKYVPATFHYKNKEYKVKARIRGLTCPHWEDKKKSWRIKFKPEELFNGIKNIDLIIPQDRAYISEHLSNYIAKKMGLLVPDSGFAFLLINGEFQGIYYETEHLGSKKFLERHHRIGNANFYSDDSWNWHKCGYPPICENICHWEKDASETISTINNFADLDYLLNLLNNQNDELFYQEIPNILDIHKFLTWQSHSMLMGSNHQAAHTNINLYFDPIHGKFEPLPWDVYPFDPLPLEGLFFDKPYNPLVTRILNIPEFRHKRNLILWDYINAPENLNEDLNFYDQTLERVKKGFFVDKNKGFSNFRFKKEVQRHREIIIKHRNKIKDNLSFSKLLMTVYLEPNNEDFQDNFNLLSTLDITNHGISAAILQGVSFTLSPKLKSIDPIYLLFDINNSKKPDKDDIKISTFKFMPNTKRFNGMHLDKLLYSETDGQLKPIAKNYRFFIISTSKLSDTELSNLQINAVNAVTQEILEPKYRYVDNRSFIRLSEVSQSPDEFLEKYEIFSSSDISAKKYEIRSGEYIIDKTVIIPKGLEISIQPDVTLKFASGASLISYSPVKCMGKNDKPIIFTSLQKERPWGVFAVIGTGANNNIFKNVIIEHGNETYLNGIYFTGALAIHAANVKIDSCVFRYNQGDDALNVKKGNCIIKNSLFNNNISDAIDCDFADGIVENNLFIGNKGDSIDLCNSPIIISSNNIKQSQDKGISVGEESNPLIINNLIHSCLMGIGIKDNSDPWIINNTIINNEFGIKSYMKKPVFGGAKGNVKNAIICGNNTNVELDNPSSLEVSNSLIEGGWKGKNILNIEPVFNDVTEENYTLRESPENRPLFKGAQDSHIDELFPEFKDRSIPLGILSLPKTDFFHEEQTSGEE